MRKTLAIFALVLCIGSFAFAAGQGQTPLAVNVTASAVCDLNGTSTVTLTFVVTSGNASGGSLNWSFAGTVFNTQGTLTIGPGLITDRGSWTQATSGPVKTFTSTVTLYGVTDGTYTAGATVHQIGGDYDDVTDTESVVVQSCASPNACDKFSQVVGQVKNNKQLSQNGTPVNFTIKGAFGDTALLTVTPAGGTTPVYTVSVPRNGDSCAYTQQWIPRVDNVYLPAGTYSAQVTGNNQEPLNFNFDLTYQAKK